MHSCSNCISFFPFHFVVDEFSFFSFSLTLPFAPYSHRFSIRVGVFFPVCCYYCLSFLLLCVTKKLKRNIDEEGRWAKNATENERKKEREMELDKYHCMVEFLYKLCSRGLIKFLQQSIWFRFWCLQRTCVMVVLFLLFAHVSNVEKWIFSHFAAAGYVYGVCENCEFVCWSKSFPHIVYSVHKYIYNIIIIIAFIAVSGDWLTGVTSIGGCHLLPI